MAHPIIEEARDHLEAALRIVHQRRTLSDCPPLKAAAELIADAISELTAADAEIRLS